MFDISTYSRDRPPILDPKIEAKSVGSGPVKTTVWSKEKMEEYLKQYDLEEDTLGKWAHITKELLLEEFKKGKSGTEIAKEYGIPIGSFGNLLRRRGVVNPNSHLFPQRKKKTEPKVEVKEEVKEEIEVKTKEDKEKAKALSTPATVILEKVEQPAVVRSEEPAEYKVDDPVQSPNHYTAGGIETIEYIKAKISDAEIAYYCKGNVLK